MAAPIFLGDHIASVECVIDGVPVPGLEGFRVESPLFEFGPLPENNVLEDQGVEAPAGSTSPSVADGFHVFVRLDEGDHRIDFVGVVEFTVEDDGFDFTFILDIGYDVTVVDDDDDDDIGDGGGDDDDDDDDEKK